ncbi:MAG: hypothetical protein K2J80_02850 [Oscillospiraceae bacterium]|nr:hypothetical protein [Oscillospiraceae bacterium]
MMRSNSKFATFFCYAVLAAGLLWLVVSGAAAMMKNGSTPPDSVQRGDVCEFTAVFADEAFEVKNTVNFIPTGKEHYYLAVSEDGIVRYLVRAKPSWISKRFTDSGLAESGGVKIKGRITRMDYKLTQEVSEMNTELIRSRTITAADTINANFYIDARYREFGGLRLLCGGGVIVVGGLFFLGIRSGILQSNKAAKIVLGAVAFVLRLIMIYTLTVGGAGV